MKKMRTDQSGHPARNFTLWQTVSDGWDSNFFAFSPLLFGSRLFPCVLPGLLEA
jgi:hypothetical protein